MGSDVVCKTVDIGNICMRMFDGQVRTLTNVRHVPNLKKNLLSLGALEARGYKFSDADGEIKVIIHDDSQKRMGSKLVQVSRKHYCW